jgi:hypothetical protein
MYPHFYNKYQVPVRNNCLNIAAKLRLLYKYKYMIDDFALRIL